MSTQITKYSKKRVHEQVSDKMTHKSMLVSVNTTDMLPCS